MKAIRKNKELDDYMQFIRFWDSEKYAEALNLARKSPYVIGQMRLANIVVFYNQLLNKLGEEEAVIFRKEAEKTLDKLFESGNALWRLKGIKKKGS
jgi:hypothetical protein